MSDDVDIEPAEMPVWLIVKLWISILLACLGSGSFLLSLAGWLALFGAATAGLVFVQREPFRIGARLRWDQALWLATGSSIVLLTHAMMGA